MTKSGDSHLPASCQSCSGHCAVAQWPQSTQSTSTNVQTGHGLNNVIVQPVSFSDQTPLGLSDWKVWQCTELCKSSDFWHQSFEGPKYIRGIQSLECRDGSPVDSCPVDSCPGGQK